MDDLLVVGNSEKLLSNVVGAIQRCFEIKNLGDVSQYLGIKTTRNNDGDFEISQASYIDSIVEAADLTDAKSLKHPLDPGYYKIEYKQYLPSNELYRRLIGMPFPKLKTGYISR